MCLIPLFVLSGVIYVRNRQKYGVPRFKTPKRLKIKIGQFHGTGLDFIFSPPIEGMESLCLARMSLNDDFFYD